MPRTITEDELMDKARELGTIGEATKWMKANGIILMPNPIPPAGGELPPLSQTQGALSTMDDEEETGTEDAMGGLDLAALDFSNTDRTKLPGLLNTLYQHNLAAQQRADQSAKQLYEEGRKRIMEKYAGPSQAEQLFALSRAMLAPRKAPGFGGFMGNVMGAFGNMETAQRQAEQEREERLLALQQQYQQGQIQREAQRPKTALELAKTYAALTKPSVPRVVGTPVVGGKVVTVIQDPSSGKIETTELGSAPAALKPIPGQTSGGQPVFMGASGPVNARGEPVTDFDVKAKPVSASEQREIFQTEDAINTALSTVRSLEEALTLNEQAYEGSLSGWRKTLGQLFGSDDPRYVATENFDNLQITSAIGNLKNVFPGAISNDERKAFNDLQAVSKYPRPVRDKIIRRAMDAAKRLISRETGRLQRLKAGEYGSRGGSTVGSGRTIRYDKNGNRI